MLLESAIINSPIQNTDGALIKISRFTGIFIASILYQTQCLDQTTLPFRIAFNCIGIKPSAEFKNSGEDDEYIYNTKKIDRKLDLLLSLGIVSPDEIWRDDCPQFLDFARVEILRMLKEKIFTKKFVTMNVCANSSCKNCISIKDSLATRCNCCKGTEFTLRETEVLLLASRAKNELYEDALFDRILNKLSSTTKGTIRQMYSQLPDYFIVSKTGGNRQYGLNLDFIGLRESYLDPEVLLGILPQYYNESRLVQIQSIPTVNRVIPQTLSMFPDTPNSYILHPYTSEYTIGDRSHNHFVTRYLPMVLIQSLNRIDSIEFERLLQKYQSGRKAVERWEVLQRAQLCTPQYETILKSHIPSSNSQGSSLFVMSVADIHRSNIKAIKVFYPSELSERELQIKTVVEQIKVRLQNSDLKGYIECLLFFGSSSNANKRSTPHQNSDIDLHLVLDDTKPGFCNQEAIKIVRELHSFFTEFGENIDFSLRLKSEIINKYGGVDFQHGRQGAYFAMSFVNAEVILGANIYTKILPDISIQKMVDDLIFAIRRYADEIRGYCIANNITAFQKYFPRFIKDGMMLVGYIDVNNIDELTDIDVMRLFLDKFSGEIEEQTKLHIQMSLDNTRLKYDLAMMLHITASLNKLTSLFVEFGKKRVFDL
jgi:hypothetical protein